METTVMNFFPALEARYDPKDYAYKKEEIPTGSYSAKLDFMLWSKSGFDYYVQDPIVGVSPVIQSEGFSNRILAIEPLQNGMTNPHLRQRVVKSIPATAVPTVSPTVELTKLSPVAIPVNYYRNKVFWQLGYSVFLILITSGFLIYMLIIIFRQRKLSIFKNEFIDNMAHELLTPVSNIGLAIQGMKNYGILEDEIKTQVYLDLCKYETDHLSGLVEQILEQSVFDSGKMELHKLSVDVNTLVLNVIKRYQISDPEAIINFQHAASPEPIELDPTHMVNILKNLIDNAIRYSKGQKEVFVKNSFENGYWVLSVNDRGIGIDKKYLKAIFDKFFRIKDTSLRPKGFGLGLNYVKQAVELHRGRVKVESSSHGSTFYVYIPALS